MPRPQPSSTTGAPIDQPSGPSAAYPNAGPNIVDHTLSLGQQAYGRPASSSGHSNALPFQQQPQQQLLLASTRSSQQPPSATSTLHPQLHAASFLHPPELAVADPLCEPRPLGPLIPEM